MNEAASGAVGPADTGLSAGTGESDAGAGTTPNFGTGAAAVAGGLLWVPYGIFEMLAPFGNDAAYNSARGYELIVDRGIYTLYNVPGALALLLTVTALLRLVRLLPASGSARIARVLALPALALAWLSLIAVAIGFDPLFTGPRVLGTLLLGVATVWAARAATARDLTFHLAILGVAAIALMPLWPLVYAVQVVPPAIGAAVIGVFGLAWVKLGWRLLARRGMSPGAAGARDPLDQGNRPGAAAAVEHGWTGV